jgi:acyl carrier protein
MFGCFADGRGGRSFAEPSLRAARDEEKLSEIELTTEGDSLEMVELIMSLERVCGVAYVESPKS